MSADSKSASSPPPQSFANWHSPHTRAHLRLMLSAVLGLAAAGIFYPMDWATRGLIGWDVAVAALLVGTGRMMLRTTLSQLKRRAAQEDESAFVILALMILAIAASLVGIVAEIANARHAGANASIYIVVSLVTLVLSWACMHVLFASHYAHRYYGGTANGNVEGGLIFPEGSAMPSYSDFIYFAFCIGMTYQVSDVATRDRGFRTMVAFHSGLSFFYNTFVLALAVNLVSGLGIG